MKIDASGAEEGQADEVLRSHACCRTLKGHCSASSRNRNVIHGKVGKTE